MPHQSLEYSLMGCCLLQRKNATKTDNTELFEKMPVYKAAIKLVVPTIIRQIITVIYMLTPFHWADRRPPFGSRGNTGDAAVYHDDRPCQSFWYRRFQFDISLFGPRRERKSKAVRSFQHLVGHRGSIYIRYRTLYFAPCTVFQHWCR